MLVLVHIPLYSSSMRVCSVVSDYFLIPLSMGFSRQESWSESSCPPPGDLPDPGMETSSPVSPALVDGFLTTEIPGKPHSPSTLLSYFPHVLSFVATIQPGPSGTNDEEPACQCGRRKRRGFDPRVRKIPWRRAYKPTSIFLSLENRTDRGAWWGYGLQDHKELDMTEVIKHALTDSLKGF